MLQLRAGRVLPGGLVQKLNARPYVAAQLREKVVQDRFLADRRSPRKAGFDRRRAELGRVNAALDVSAKRASWSRLGPPEHAGLRPSGVWIPTGTSAEAEGAGAAIGSPIARLCYLAFRPRRTPKSLAPGQITGPEGHGCPRRIGRSGQQNHIPRSIFSSTSNGSPLVVAKTTRAVNFSALAA